MYIVCLRFATKSHDINIWKWMRAAAVELRTVCVISTSNSQVWLPAPQNKQASQSTTVRLSVVRFHSISGLDNCIKRIASFKNAAQ